MSSNFEDLENEVSKHRVADAITKAVQLSFLSEETRSTPTEAEIRRRSQICMDHYKIMRNDLGWSITKICDQLPRSLVAELCGLGADFLDGMTRKSWVQKERRTPGGLILPD